MIPELKDGIYTKGLTLPGFETHNFDFDKIRVDNKRPYINFFGLPTTHDFDSNNTYDVNYIQFDVYAKELSDARDFADIITDAFDFCDDIAINGYELVVCKRTLYTIQRHLDIWHIIIQYEIEIEKTR